MQRTLILSYLSLTLVYITYTVSQNPNTKSINCLLSILYEDKSLVYSLLWFLFLYLVWISFKVISSLLTSKPYYAQKISLKEYEIQRQTYTQLKLNELQKSSVFKEFQQKSLNSN